MWTITNDQLSNISESMKQEFKDYVRFLFDDRRVQLDIFPEDFDTIIEKQLLIIKKYSIIETDNTLKLIELAMTHPILNNNELPEGIESILESDMPNSVKIESIKWFLTCNE